ncbi:MAG: DUF2155 domain-containing protein [Proteobacteria bacterium]|nr:DUF2155 domain-containing protein [Pseudomonadota bacterium]
MRARPILAGAAALLLALLVPAPLAAQGQGMDRAVLRALDKVTARVSTIEAPVGEVVGFGTLEIVARACRKRPPEEPPESAAFLEIWETRRGEPTVSLFRGWMFASSPALNALEHPVYDVWIIDCRGPGVVQGGELQPERRPQPQP